MSDNNNLKIDLLQKIYDLEQKGVKSRKALTAEEPIESLIFEHALLKKKYEKICENNYYKKLSHFTDIVNNMSNEPNKINTYTDIQFEEDLKKWVANTKYKTTK